MEKPSLSSNHDSKPRTICNVSRMHVGLLSVKIRVLCHGGFKTGMRAMRGFDDIHSGYLQKEETVIFFSKVKYFPKYFLFYRIVAFNGRTMIKWN